MMRLDEIVLAIAELKQEDLEIWVHEALVETQEHRGERVFTDTACARVRLICTLHYDMEIDANALPVVLDLIDQLHETRNRLHSLGGAVMVQDRKIRKTILALVKNGELP